MLPYRSVSSYRTTRIVRNPIGIGRDARFSSSPRVCMFVQPIALFISLLNFCSSPITNYKIGASATQTVQPHILYTFILYTNGINIQSGKNISVCVCVFKIMGNLKFAHTNCINSAITGWMECYIADASAAIKTASLQSYIHHNTLYMETVCDSIFAD